MRVPVVIRHKELSLAVVAISELRDDIAKALQALPKRINVRGRPVEPNPFIVLRWSRSARPLIEPEVQMLVVHHATYELAVVTHCTVHGKTEPVHPKAKTLFEISTGDNWNAGLYEHRCLRAAYRITLGLRRAGERVVIQYPTRADSFKRVLGGPRTAHRNAKSTRTVSGGICTATLSRTELSLAVCATSRAHSVSALEVWNSNLYRPRESVSAPLAAR